MECGAGDDRLVDDAIMYYMLGTLFNRHDCER
jgi:hypothetical protein